MCDLISDLATLKPDQVNQIVVALCLKDSGNRDFTIDMVKNMRMVDSFAEPSESRANGPGNCRNFVFRVPGGRNAPAGKANPDRASQGNNEANIGDGYHCGYPTCIDCGKKHKEGWHDCEYYQAELRQAAADGKADLIRSVLAGEGWNPPAGPANQDQAFPSSNGRNGGNLGSEEFPSCGECGKSKDPHAWIACQCDDEFPPCDDCGKGTDPHTWEASQCGGWSGLGNKYPPAKRAYVARKDGDEPDNNTIASGDSWKNDSAERDADSWGNIGDAIGDCRGDISGGGFWDASEQTQSHTWGNMAGDGWNTMPGALRSPKSRCYDHEQGDDIQSTCSRYNDRKRQDKGDNDPFYTRDNGWNNHVIPSPSKEYAGANEDNQKNDLEDLLASLKCPTSPPVEAIGGFWDAAKGYKDHNFRVFEQCAGAAKKKQPQSDTKCRPPCVEDALESSPSVPHEKMTKKYATKSVESTPCPSAYREFLRNMRRFKDTEARSKADKAGKKSQHSQSDTDYSGNACERFVIIGLDRRGDPVFGEMKDLARKKQVQAKD